VVGLPFALYYIIVVLFWLTKIIKTLGAKAILRSLNEPTRAKRYFAIVYVWGVVYATLGLIGYVALTDNLLNYDNVWLLWACAMVSGAYIVNNVFALMRLPFEDLTPVLERARTAVENSQRSETNQ
jgi:hypothetical protein